MNASIWNYFVMSKMAEVNIQIFANISGTSTHDQNFKFGQSWVHCVNDENLVAEKITRNLIYEDIYKYPYFLSEMF